MKRRGIVSVILVLAIVFSSAVPAFAVKAPEYKADCPYIFVHGLMGSTVYTDPDDPDSDTAWPPKTSSIVSAVFKSIPALFGFMFTRDWDKLAERVIPLVNKIFDPIILGPDGEPKDKSGVRFEYPAPETIHKDSQLTFVYDWRLDPIHTAELLNDFINYVLKCSGSEQVVLECHSYGGVITNTYARLYGTEKVRSFAFNSTAVFGETYTGELFTGQLVFDPDSLTAYLDGVFDFNKNEKFLDGLFAFLYKIGTTKRLCNLANKMVDGLGIQALSDAIFPMFGGWLSIWSMVPDDMIDEAYDFAFNNIWKDQKELRKGLMEKVDDFNTRIRPYKAETLKKIDTDCNLYVFARHGYSAMFMTPSWRYASDGVIDVKFASFGAVAANYREQLSDSYLEGKDAKYISPDKTVDASACMFPEQTWFIRHMTHSFGCSDYDTMIKALLYHDGQATTETYKDYPMFMYYNEDTGSLETDKNQTE
ncbi:MAG: hypothetical protein IKH65_06705 [Clostridia bacterium]|nr:hypothetical protein [Clostridia bacterium]